MPNFDQETLNQVQAWLIDFVTEINPLPDPLTFEYLYRIGELLKGKHKNLGEAVFNYSNDDIHRAQHDALVYILHLAGIISGFSVDGHNFFVERLMRQGNFSSILSLKGKNLALPDEVYKTGCLLFEHSPLDHPLFCLRHDEYSTKDQYVSVPLDRAGYIFKKIFSYVLGFQWLFDIVHRSNWFVKVLSLPVLDYKRDAFLQHAKFSFGDKKIDYPLILLTGWAIPFNYLSRNLGKLFGWVLVTPFIFPAYVAIKTYFAIKQAIVHSKWHKQLKKISVSESAELYCMNRLNYTDSIEILTVKPIHFQDISDALIKKQVDASTSGRIYSDYRDDRAALLEKKYHQSWLKMVVTGIFVLPLFVTIPQHKKLVAERQQAKKEMEEDQPTWLDHFFKNDPNYCPQYVLGRFSLEKTNPEPELAFSYFSKVPESSFYYHKAMEQCAHYLM